MNLVYPYPEGCNPLPSYVLKTRPNVEPIGKDEVKANSRIDITDDDLLIQAKILGVRTMVEKIYDLAIITQTWTMYLDWLPPLIEIYKRPLQKINSIKYLDDSGAQQTLATNLYNVDINSRPPRILPSFNAIWPSVQLRPAAVAIEFDAGYGDTANDVPQNVIQYLLIKVADFYENRESYTEARIQTHDFVDNLMNPERLFSV